MKIDGHKKVEVYLEGKYRQPYPVVESKITVDGNDVDFAIATGQMRIEIDGVMYSGEMLICMNKE